MLDALHAIEARLPELLRDEAGWTGLYVDYHPPVVERLWRQVDGVRVYLHRILPCAPDDALFHPHPWPSAMRLIEGTYEMAIGYGSGTEAPPRAALLMLTAGSEYEMTDPNSWHYVRPVSAPTMSLMVSGPPWDRPTIAVGKTLDPLGDEQRARLFDFFRQRYPAR